MASSPTGAGFAAAIGGGLLRLVDWQTEKIRDMILDADGSDSIAYSPDGKHIAAGLNSQFFDESLAISTFYLREPAVANASNFEASMAMSALTEGSAKPPPGEHVTVDAISCRCGMNVDGKDQMWCAMKASCDGLTALPFNRWDASQVPEEYCCPRHGRFSIEISEQFDCIKWFDCKFFDLLRGGAW